ncbi:universal stress protein [Salinarimonas chemoclinalis]|uniref:universal stress protein n=1 Tax=Salinarimonas chemoclinalis TaxID=3241599 RepID=UPI003555D398
MISTIVVAVDGSEHQDAVVALAAEIAQARGARLVLAHALLRGVPYGELYAVAERLGFLDRVKAELDEASATPVMPAAAMGGAIPVIMVSPDTLRHVSDEVIAAARKAPESAGVTVEARIADAPPAQAIVEIAREEGADLLVIGSRGLGRLQGLILGSVSQKVVHDAPCAVLVVK